MMDMSLVTIKSILEGIAAKLEDLFQLPIYVEEVEQDMEEPCFFVTNLNAQSEKGLCATYTESLFFDVQYLGSLKDRDKNTKVMEVQQRLLREMEAIEVEEKWIHLNNRRTEKINEILHFFFDVDIRLIKVSSWPKMQTLRKEGAVKDE